MAFEISVSRMARNEIREAVDYIAVDSASAAMRWADKLESLLQLIAEDPLRFSVIAEVENFQKVYRSAKHFSHRVIYRFDNEEQIVFVVRVYHSARRPLKSDDLAN